MKQGRGQLTKRVLDKGQQLLGYQLTVMELRLMAFFQYTVMNSQVIIQEKINLDEQTILDKWEECGFFKRKAGRIICTKEFYDALGEILYLAYGDVD